MSSYAEHVINKFLPRGVLVDTNLLLLYAVGQYDEELLLPGRFDRLAAYSLEDFHLLSRLMSLFQVRVTTPHVLTEVSNWAGYLPQLQKVVCLQTFPATFRGFAEIPAEAHVSFEHSQFRFLGLTDVAIA